jgi:hypothetical protein
VALCLAHVMCRLRHHCAHPEQGNGSPGRCCRAAIGQGEHGASDPSRKDRAVHCEPRRLFLRQTGKPDLRGP